MTKIFATVVGGMLAGIGFAVLFFNLPDALTVSKAHGSILLLTGGAGLALRRYHRPYTGWIGVGASLLGLIGFSGVERLMGSIDLPTGYNYFYALLGISGLLVFFGSKPDSTAPIKKTSTPEATS